MMASLENSKRSGEIQTIGEIGDARNDKIENGAEPAFSLY